MTYKELQKLYHMYEDDEPEKPTTLYTCPKCGYAVRSVPTNNVKCGGCGKRVIIQNGVVKGWR
uniref:hypothetical protein n=1 Tax=Acetatifactor sp. TaxID=1872090 RepID=UPI00405728C4